MNKAELIAALKGVDDRALVFLQTDIDVTRFECSEVLDSENLDEDTPTVTLR